MQKLQLITIIRKWVLFGLVTFIVQHSAAQEAGGEKSLGVRLGGSSGMTFKSHAKSNKSAFEIIAGWNFDENVDGVNVNAFGNYSLH